MFRLCSPNSRLSIGFVFPIAAFALAACGSVSSHTADDARASAEEARVRLDAMDSRVSDITERLEKSEAEAAALRQQIADEEQARVELAKKHNMVNDEVSRIEQRLGM